MKWLSELDLDFLAGRIGENAEPLTLDGGWASAWGMGESPKKEPIGRPGMLPKLPRVILGALLLGCFTISSDLPARNPDRWQSQKVGEYLNAVYSVESARLHSQK